jgi:hypothetical protein
MRPAFNNIDQQGQYGQMLGAIRYCLRIRNQYAHCNWADDRSGLFFTNLEDTAAAAEGWEYRWYRIDVPVLEKQEEFFVYTQSWLYHLEHLISQTSDRPIYPPFPAPLTLARPPLHNAPSQHVPSWISEDEKVRHLARAKEAEGRGRS